MYFPLYFDLTQKKILIVGGGKIATRRLFVLDGFVGSITIVAPDITDTIREKLKKRDPLSGETHIEWIEKKFACEDLENRDLVFAATNDPVQNRAIYEACHEKKIPVNVCSDRNLCDFQFPSIIVNEDTVIGVNASGEDHSRVRQIREQLEDLLGVTETESRYQRKR